MRNKDEYKEFYGKNQLLVKTYDLVTEDIKFSASQIAIIIVGVSEAYNILYLLHFIPL